MHIAEKAKVREPLELAQLDVLNTYFGAIKGLDTGESFRIFPSVPHG